MGEQACAVAADSRSRGWRRSYPLPEIDVRPSAHFRLVRLRQGTSNNIDGSTASAFNAPRHAAHESQTPRCTSLAHTCADLQVRTLGRRHRLRRQVGSFPRLRQRGGIRVAESQRPRLRRGH